MRVHPEVLAAERLPPKLVTKDIWHERFEDIRAFERYLTRNGTVVLKFFLHVSKDEQRERFLDRLNEPAKTWKFSMSDVAERKFWDRYQAAYQDVIGHTSTRDAPWYVVPADRKWFARVVIGSVIVSALDRLDLRFPRVDKASLDEFDKVRRALEAEGGGKGAAKAFGAGGEIWVAAGRRDLKRRPHRLRGNAGLLHLALRVRRSRAGVRDSIRQSDVAPFGWIVCLYRFGYRDAVMRRDPEWAEWQLNCCCRYDGPRRPHPPSWGLLLIGSRAVWAVRWALRGCERSPELCALVSRVP